MQSIGVERAVLATVTRASERKTRLSAECQILQGCINLKKFSAWHWVTFILVWSESQALLKTITPAYMV